MSSEDPAGLVPPSQSGLGSQQALFGDDPSLRDSGPKPRDLGGPSYIQDRFFPPQGATFRPSLFSAGPDLRGRKWSAGSDTPSGGDATDGNEDGDDDDEDEDEEDVRAGNGSYRVDKYRFFSRLFIICLPQSFDLGFCLVTSLVAVLTKSYVGKTFGHYRNLKLKNVDIRIEFEVRESDPIREVAVKDGNSALALINVRPSPSDIHHHQARIGNYANAVTIAEPDGALFYSQYLRGPETAEDRQKDVLAENACGFSGRKDVNFQKNSSDPLRAIFSDPLTGALMDDAMILPCGHSFGSGGMHHVIGLKACPTCSHSVSEDSVRPNLSLRAAIQAFRREEEMFQHSPKRRRERSEQDRNNYADSLSDLSRSKSAQFPFAVRDRVIIKGNKRTPPRFVGREAIVTTQCLNGWYVVKTIDNAESVKLQYRSLAKVTTDSSLRPSSSKMAPNLLQS